MELGTTRAILKAMENFEELQKMEISKEHFRDIKNPEIAELEDLIKNILGFKLFRERINSGAYDVVIGDDASGRIPALIFSKILKGTYKKSGVEPPKTFFVGLPRIADKEFEKELYDFVEHGVGLSAKRVLIVTDAVYSGIHLKSLTKILDEKNVAYDIVTLGIETEVSQAKRAVEKGVRGKGYLKSMQERSYVNPRVEVQRLEKLLKTQIFWGMEGTPQIFGKRHLGGVKKQTGQLFAKPLRELDDKKYDPEIIKDVREDIKKLSDKLLKWYEGVLEAAKYGKIGL